MIRYVVTTWAGRRDVNLSKPGHWGNLPHPSLESAEAAARLDAGRSPLTIEHVRRKRPVELSC